MAWHRRADRESSEVWLEVRKPRLSAAPSPPADLEPWLVYDQIEDSTVEMPELRDETLVPVQNEMGEQGSELRRIADHPDMRTLWERYVETQWWPWAEADRRARPVQRVYTDLFSMYQKQQRLGEQYEVVLGLGLLSWRAPDHQDVRRHLIVANASISFDATRGVITIGPAGEGANPQLEQDMLDPHHRPDPETLHALESQVADVGDQVWEPTPIDAALAAWVHSVSPKGTYSESLSPVDKISTDPVVSLAPAVVLRRRAERSYVRAFEEIIKQIQDGAPIPAGVGQFVTMPEDRSVGDQAGTSEPEGGGAAAEVYFPLESNDAQRQIIERLSGHQGVLVQGPPGTGKSHTIVNLICHLVATGKRVLVTSHTARALKVLQRYIREKVSELSPLAVVLMGDDRDALQAMEQSVQGITQRHNQWDPEASRKRITNLQRELDEARRDEARIQSDLRAIREQETYVHPVRFGSYEGTLQTIASKLRHEEGQLGWIMDRPQEVDEPPLSTQELIDLLALMREGTLDDWGARGYTVLGTKGLPPPERMAELVAREKEAQAAFQQTVTIRDHPAYIPLRNADEVTRGCLLGELEDLIKAFDRLGQHFQSWPRRAAVEVLGEQDRSWRELLEVTREQLSHVGEHARWADQTAASGFGDRDRRTVRSDAQNMIDHLSNGGRWRFGPFQTAQRKRANYLRREVKIGGRPAERLEDLASLVRWLDVDIRLRFLRDRWAEVHKVDARSTFSEQSRLFEDLCEPLSEAVALHDQKARISDLIHGVVGLPEPTWHKVDTLHRLHECGVAVRGELQLRSCEAELSRCSKEVAALVSSRGTDPSGDDLVQAIEARDVARYRQAYARAVQNEQLARRFEQREHWLSALQKASPRVAATLRAEFAEVTWDERAEQFEHAWNWARARAWVERLSDPEAERRHLLELDSAKESIRGCLKDIAVEKAWASCFSRMTEHERQHLVAWAKAVRSIGAGTGKYVAHHRRNAREHMNECRSAIPAWVMPLYRVAETIRPGKELFDVVIVDEASQSGPEALLLAYLAKKIVVVGDDKQISPEHVGVKGEDVLHLRARHMSGIGVPHPDSYGIDHSFFDLAEIQYPGRIRLREHFRCMPEIIQYSNNLCYSGEPLIPLRQYGHSRLSPVVSARYISDGHVHGTGSTVVNRPEAEAIVREIRQMHTDERYRGKTFGVISLLGYAQAGLIERLLLEHLSPQDIHERNLVCGDAYAFQGDERDAILLSLVSAPSELRRIHPLTREQDRRRFNVAASRARDQMVLFHSVTLNDLSPKCFRYSLLQYCQNPSVALRPPLDRSLADLQHLAAKADRDRMRPPSPFGSWFELDVFLRIASRGFRIIPQYEVAGYRIDLVVEGMAGRVAVECDGNHWHGPDQYQADMARQRVLERCGWKFWRVRGSAFYLHPEGAMEDLWTALDRAGIHPDGADVLPGTEETPRKGRWANPITSAEPDVSTPGVLPAGGRLLDGHHSAEDGQFRGGTGQARFPDPTVANPADLIPGLIEIIDAEGPISTGRLYRVFVKRAGKSKVGRQVRSTLNKALWKAIRDGSVDERDEAVRDGMKERVVRIAGSSPIVVRGRGNRDFHEIPPSEVATVMTQILQQNAEFDTETLYRRVLDFYEIRRMTVKIKKRLESIHGQREILARGR